MKGDVLEQIKRELDIEEKAIEEKNFEKAFGLFNEAKNNYHKQILSLSGGALGVTIAFIKNIIGYGNIQYWSLAIGAWVFWVLSIICVLSTYYLSASSFGHWCEEITEKKTATKKSILHEEFVSDCSGGFFVLAIILFVIFVVINVKS